MFEFHSPNDLKNRRVSLNDRQEIQPQEIFLDKISRDRMNKDGFNERKMEVPLSHRSFQFLVVCSIIISSLFLLRSFQLQVIRGEQYARMAERNRFAYLTIDNTRGIIYDRNMEQLVYNQPRFSLVFDKEALENDNWNDEVKVLSDTLSLEYDEILAMIANSDSNEVVIIEDIPQENLIILEVRTRNMSSFRIENEAVRHYVSAEVFSHIIGHTGRISPGDRELKEGGYLRNARIGRTGVERSYEADLRVVPGQIRLGRDAKGQVHSEEIVSMGESGNDIVLWIDAGLQRKIYQELERITAEVGSEVASAVAIDPRTGGVLAMVGYPGFDNNIFTRNTGFEELFQDPRNPLFNRVTAGTYSVGSVIKPLIGLAALEEGIITPETQFYSPGRISIPNPWNPSKLSVFADLAPRGWYDVRRAIALSSNVFFYIVGGGYREQPGLGPTSIKRYLNLFGWGNLTGIDIPGEKAGFIPDPEWKKETMNDRWRVGDSYNMSIGQGYISVTPLQVTTAFTAIANRGKLLRPMVVRDVIGKDGRVIRTNQTEVISTEFVGSDSLEVIRKGMKDAVEHGSATLLNTLPVTAGAKTGTAQIPRRGHYNNWITVFAPYDEPEIVLTILVEEVEGIRAATLPVAKEVLEWYFRE